ncbi:MAG: tetratricopeptide repeat protein [Bacteroidetes bacterium]|nr:tetratricopeptide repeat protein [Bacteroidota bacterium]
MKTILLCITSFLLYSTALNAQPFNQEITNEKGATHLLGKINKEGFSNDSFAWFTKNYDSYNPNKTAIDTLENQLSKYSITAFMGTWCGDSKREVPKFYKILEEANFPLERLTMVAVSRDRDTYKQSPGGEHEAKNIHRVPTFIVYKNGREVNRIVEGPIETLEEDLVKIMEKDYTPNYHGVSVLDELLSEMDSQKFNRKQKKLIPQLKKEVKNMYEINTYSSVLFYSHREEEAIIAARLNTLLFPKEARVYSSLGNKLYAMEDYEGAVENYEKALSLDPDNETYKKTLASWVKNEAME